MTSRPFASAAEFYARYRPPYPEPLLAGLRARTGLDGRQRLVDLACGTGEVVLPLAPYCRTAVGVDEEPAMLDAARARAAGHEVRWVLGRAEDVALEPGSVDLVTVGNAFHRLDRALVARRARDWLAPGGHLALLNTNSVWRGTEEWQRVAVDIISAWTGRPPTNGPHRTTPSAPQRTTPSARHHATPSAPHRTTPSAPRHATPTHADVIRDAGFDPVEERSFPTRYTWSLDSFVGYLYSTSVAAPAVLGDRADGFERELRRALLTIEPTGQLVETIQFDLLVARAG